MGTTVLAAVGLYLFLLGREKLSARQAARTLDRLETLRVGSLAADFDHAVQECRVTKSGSVSTCLIDAGAFRSGYPWKLVWMLPADWPDRITAMLRRAGLRWWRISVSATIGDERIQEINVTAIVDGRYESLEADWSISNQLPAHLTNLHPNPDQQKLTYMGWFHITSGLSGEGFRIRATPDSTEEEMLAGRINPSCLFSFRGCDGLCELLPDAARFLKEHHRSWGGWTSVPRSKCELK